MSAVPAQFTARLSALLRSPRAAWAVLILVGIGVWVASLVRTGVNFTVSLQGGGARSAVTSHLAGLLPDGTSVVDGTVRLQVENLPWYLRLLTTLPVSLVLVEIAVALWLMIPVVTQMRRGRPFEADASRRLYWLAALVTVAIAAHPIAVWLVGQGMLAHLGASGGSTWGPFPGLDMTGLIIAYLITVVAESAVHGKRLSDELEGLV